MDHVDFLELQALLHTDRDKLLTGTYTDNELESIGAKDEYSELVDWILDSLLFSRFEEILLKKEIWVTLGVPLTVGSLDVCILESIKLFLTDTGESQHLKHRQLIVLFVGIAALQLFVQLNWVGPMKDGNDDMWLLLPFSGFPRTEETKKDILELLTLCNEPVYPLVKHPELLLVGKTFLDDSNNKSFSSSWWKLRYLSVHQALLLERNTAVYCKISQAITDAITCTTANHKDLLILLNTEAALTSLQFHDISKARQYLKEVQENSGLSVQFSGALGKRTKFQQIPYSQLFLKTEQEKKPSPTSYFHITVDVPRDVKLHDETLLSNINFIDQDNTFIEMSFRPEEQTIILALAALHQKQNAHDELQSEQMLAYANCLLSQPGNFCVQFCALMLRSKLEKQKLKKLERSMMQLQALLDSTKCSLDNPSRRLQLFYSTPMAPTWVVEKELANVLLSLGSVKSALDIYLHLKMWEECIFCYKQLQRNDKALEIIEEQLKEGETPLLLCLKGDVTNDPTFYEKAWVLSGCRSARAKRSLGYFYFQKKEYKECIPHLLDSIEINNMEQKVWFFLGHAATQTEDYKLAAKSYRTLINLDPDSFEAWNNLSNAYIKMNDKHRAWRTLQESIKCNFEEWRVWENYLLVSVDVGAFEEAINAFHRLVDIKGKHADDEVLNILAGAIIQNLNDIHGQPASNLLEKMLKLLGHITSTETSSFKTWKCYATLLEHKADTTGDKELLDRVLQYQQKALNIMKSEFQKTTQERSAHLCNELLLSCSRLSDLYFKRFELNNSDTQGKQQMHALKLTLVNTILLAKKELDHFTENEVNEIILPSIEQLNSKLNDVLSILE